MSQYYRCHYRIFGLNALACEKVQDLSLDELVVTDLNYIGHTFIIGALISVLQLCAYIFAILFEFSGIFNRLFRLKFLYFRRNTALSIESGRTAFVTSPP